MTMKQDSPMNFRLIVHDTQLGSCKPVPTAPIHGRSQAEELLERIRRANRDHRLQYEVEPVQQ
jgi:hypothetical protein